MSEADETTDPNDRQFVKALARGLDVLRCFDRPHAVLNVAEIARRLGMSQPTAWRLCYTILKCGFLVRSSTGRGLSIGAPAITLGYIAAQGQNARSVAMPYLRSIVDDIGTSATLSLRADDEMIWMEQIDGDMIVRDHAIGWRAPLDTVAAGLAVLAALPEQEREMAMARMALADPERLERHRDRVAQAVASLADNGHVELTGGFGGRYASVAVPLFPTGTAPSEQWCLVCGGIMGAWSENGLGHVAQRLVATRALLAPAMAALEAQSASPDSLRA